jgi:hypothetical protein
VVELAEAADLEEQRVAGKAPAVVAVLVGDPPEAVGRTIFTGQALPFGVEIEVLGEKRIVGPNRLAQAVGVGLLEMAEVGGQGGGDLADELLQAVDAGVNAFAGAAGVGVVDKDRFSGAFQFADQDMMHDAVAEVGGEDFPQLGTVDDKTDRTSGRVGVIDQGVPQRQQAFFLPGFEAQRVQGIALVAPALQVMPVQIFQGKQQGASFSGAHGPRVVFVVLIVVVLVAVIGVEVPRVMGIRRVLGTGPVPVGSRIAAPLLARRPHR